MATELRRERRTKQKRQRQPRRATKPAPRIRNQLIVAAAIVVLAALAWFGLSAAGVFEPPPAPLDLNAPQYQLSAGQTIGTLQQDMGTAHIPVSQPGHYNTDPPTSGEHWSSTAPAAPAPWGIKDSMLPREVTTHNLEHGGIVIAYNHLSPAEVDQLKSVVRTLMSGQYRKI